MSYRTVAESERKRTFTAKWLEDDYLMVTCGAMSFIKQGYELLEGLKEAQKLLPQDKQRNERSLKYVSNTALMAKTLQLVQRMTPEGIAEQVAKLEHAAAPVKSDPKHPTRWTELEWALVLRRVKYMKDDLADGRSYALIAYDAQMHELPRDRWRAKASLIALQASQPSSVPARIERYDQVASLLEDYPFDAGRKAPPGAQQAADAGIELVPPHPAPAAPAEPAQEPDTLVQEWESPAGPRARRARKAQEPLPPVLATTPPPPPVHAPTEPILAFGNAFATGMAGMMEAITVKVAHEVALSLEHRTRQIAEGLLTHVVAELHARMETLVKATLERELGGRVEIPAVAPAPDLTGAGLPDALKLDVVGLVGGQVTEVKRILNGYADAVRFIDVALASNWEPRHTVILNTKFVSHAMENKCRKAGVKPIRVYGTATAVVNAIRTLYENAGIELRQEH